MGDYPVYTPRYINMDDNYNNVDSNHVCHDNNNNNNHPNVDAYSSVERSAYNLRKAVELRQARLQQRQQQLQQQQQQQSLQHNATTNVVSDIASPTHSPTRRYAHSTRRKRLQRQTPTEVDEMDIAYAADLEEEAEDDYEDEDLLDNDDAVLKTAEKRLPLFPLRHQAHRLLSSISTPAFAGQPSSLPSCYSTTITTTAYHQLQQHHQQHHFQHAHRLKHEESFDSSTTTTTTTTDTAASPSSPSLRRHNFAMLKRDNSTQSESSSRYSSVDSLLEARKPDPEAILINLGFGPVDSEDILSRIPKRFLKPSQVRGIDTDAFVRRLQLASNLADHSVLGYRGLTGNPDVPPSRIVAKIMQRFEVNERKKSMGSIEHTI